MFPIAAASNCCLSRKIRDGGVWIDPDAFDGSQALTGFEGKLKLMSRRPCLGGILGRGVSFRPSEMSGRADCPGKGFTTARGRTTRFDSSILSVFPRGSGKQIKRMNEFKL